LGRRQREAYATRASDSEAPQMIGFEGTHFRRSVSLCRFCATKRS
jgi:hypothetical protein